MWRICHRARGRQPYATNCVQLDQSSARFPAMRIAVPSAHRHKGAQRPQPPGHGCLSQPALLPCWVLTCLPDLFEQYMSTGRHLQQETGASMVWSSTRILSCLVVLQGWSAAGDVAATSSRPLQACRQHVHSVRSMSHVKSQQAVRVQCSVQHCCATHSCLPLGPELTKCSGSP